MESKSSSSQRRGRVLFHRIRLLFFWMMLAEDPPRVQAWSIASTFVTRPTTAWTGGGGGGGGGSSTLWTPRRSTRSSTRSSTTTPTNTNSILTMMGTRGKKIRKEKRRASQEPTPPAIPTPYGPIRLTRPPRVCDGCRGRGVVRCSVCEGRGVIRETGHRKTNPVIGHADRLPKSLWTSVEVYNGHRHHTVMEVTGSRRKHNMQVRMRNCCGEQQDFWISANELRNKEVWRMGWITFHDIIRAQGGPLLDARICFLCKGNRILECVDCGGVGEIPSYEPLY